MPVTNYIWDELDDTVLMEKDENGNTIAEYTHEPGPFGGLISERRGTVAFSPTDRVVATGSAHRRSGPGGTPSSVLLWNIDRPTEPVRLRGHNRSVECARFSPDGALLATGDLAGQVIVWDSPAGLLAASG